LQSENAVEAGWESEFAGHSRHVDGTWVLKEATKPGAVTVPSDVNNTCMYPVSEVYVVVRSTELPDSLTSSCPLEHDDDAQLRTLTKS
jgi:hypothetical protein